MFLNFDPNATLNSPATNLKDICWPRVACGHHVLSIEHLLGELWHSEGAVLLRLLGPSCCQGRETGHEEVKSELSCPENLGDKFI